MLYNKAELKKHKEDIVNLSDTLSSTKAVNFPFLSLDNQLANRNKFKTYRDYSIIAMGLFYVLNIVDATVDAHLFNFNVNKTLTGNIQPKAGFNTIGATLTLKLR